MRLTIAVLQFATIFTLVTALKIEQQKNETIFKKFQASENSTLGKPIPEQWANSSELETITKWVDDPEYKMIIKAQEITKIRDEVPGSPYAFGEYKDTLHLDIMTNNLTDGKLPTIYVVQSPANLNKTGKKAMVHIHGGNGFAGDGIQNMKLFNEVAKVTDTVVFSPTYRMSPLNKIPIPQQDCADVISYVHQNAAKYGVDPNKIFVTGDSAGGNIAAGAMLLLKEQKKDIVKMMILFQPMLGDLIYSVPRDGATKGEHEMGHIIQKSFELLAKDFVKQYDDIMLYPSKMSIDQAKQLPPTVLITTEYDIFKRDAYAFKRKLEQAGKLLDFANYAEVGHNSFNVLPFEHPVLHQFFEDWVNLVKTHM